MRNVEKQVPRHTYATTLAALSLLVLSACNSNSEQMDCEENIVGTTVAPPPVEDLPETATTIVIPPDFLHPGPITYDSDVFADGTREIRMYGPNSVEPIDILHQFCDGNDLIDYSERGGFEQRSVGHEVCDDGTITEDDNLNMNE